jgi:hypothetical protein
MKYYAATKYPEIYKNVYWGWFNTNSAKPNDEIINARNKFIEDNGIVKSTDYKCLTAFSEHDYNFDHLECYRAKDGQILVVCSIYDKNLDKDDSQYHFPVKVGFKIHQDLYSESTTTYLQIFDNLKQLQVYCRNLNSKNHNWSIDHE